MHEWIRSEYKFQIKALVLTSLVLPFFNPSSLSHLQSVIVPQYRAEIYLLISLYRMFYVDLMKV